MTQRSGAEQVKLGPEYNTQNVKPKQNIKKDMKNIMTLAQDKYKENSKKNRPVLETQNNDQSNSNKKKQSSAMNAIMNHIPGIGKKHDKTASSNNANTHRNTSFGASSSPSQKEPPRTPNESKNDSTQNSLKENHNSYNGATTRTSDHVPPPPPMHQTSRRSSSLPENQPNMNNNGNNASPLASGNTSAHPIEPSLSRGMVTAYEKDETKINETEYLTLLDTILKQINDYEAYQNDTRDAITKIQSEIKQLQQKKDGNASKIKGLQVELYDLLKQVKVTDDDLSTIQKKLAALSGKLSNFPPNSKKSFNKKEPVKSKEEIIAFFKSCWNDVDTEYVIENLFQDQTGIDYALVSVLVEKLIIYYFVKDIFQSPIYMDFEEINSAYQKIEKLFKEAGHDEWNSNLRLRCVKTTLTEIERDPGVAEESKNSRAKLCDKLLEKLSVIYDVNDITPRIKKLVDMACDLSFPMNSQEERIKIRDLKPDEPFYTNQVKAQYGSDKSPDTVRLGISPVFLIKNSIHFDEDDDMNMEYDDGRSFNGDNNYDYDDDDEDDEDGEEKEKPNIGFYEDNHYTLVYAGRAIGCNERAKLDEQTKIEIDT